MIRKNIKSLTDIPNIGKSIQKTLLFLGINQPLDLIGRDLYQMYGDLCEATDKVYDPCVIDIFISAVKYMEGAPAKKWWEYTAERKKKMAACK